MTRFTRDPDSDSDSGEEMEVDDTEVPTQDDLDFIVADEEVEESDYDEDEEEDSYDPEDDDDDDPDYEPVDDVDDEELEELTAGQLRKLYVDTRDELEGTKNELIQTHAYYRGIVRELQQTIRRLNRQ